MNRIFSEPRISTFSKIGFGLLMILFLAKGNAQVCSNPNNLFGINSSGLIYPINTTTGAVGSLINTAKYTGSAPSQSNALGYNQKNGMFYYFKIDPAPLVTQQFVSYNPVTNTYTALKASPSTSSAIVSGCVSFDGSGYYCVDVKGKFYYYSIASNSWTTITSMIVDMSGNNISTLITSQGSGDMAIDGYGNLWVLPSSSTNYSLYEINAPLPTTAVTKVTCKQIIAPTTKTPAGLAFQGMAFNQSGQAYMIDGSGTLYQLKNSTTISKIATLSNTSVNRDLTSCSFPFTVLPLNWESFTALENTKEVTLNWEISNAREVESFYVEKSNDNINWTSIDHIAFDETQNIYSTVDPSPQPGNNYYRIRSVDFNGNESYSVIKTVNIKSEIKMMVWPNPTRNTVFIQNNGTDNNMNAQVFDLYGKTVIATVLHAGKNAIDFSSLSKGAYILHIISSDGTVYNEKLLKE
jgi:hypothetical protein